MNLRHLAALAAVLVLTTSATHAQTPDAPSAIQNRFGLYLTPMATRISNSKPDTGVFAFLGPNNTSAFFEGFGIGLYDDFLHSKNVEGGVDLRGSIVRSSGAQLSTFLIGARVAFQPATLRIRPYVQVSGGVGSSRAAHNSLSSSKGEYGAAVGVDYPLGRRVSFRVIEVGYDSLTTVSSTTVNAGTSIPASQLININTGIVFRFP